MGQSLTTQEKHNIKREIYTLYPGLEQQLEMAFSCHDIEGTLTLPYATLEPVIRHLLMQYGLIEYVTRFSKESGKCTGQKAYGAKGLSTHPILCAANHSSHIYLLFILHTFTQITLYVVFMMRTSHQMHAQARAQPYRMNVSHRKPYLFMHMAHAWLALAQLFFLWSSCGDVATQHNALNASPIL